MLVGGAISVGVVSIVTLFIEHFLTLEAQIGAFLVLGILVGVSWTVAQVERAVHGFAIGLVATATVAVVLQVYDTQLAQELPFAWRILYEFMRFVVPVSIYSLAGITPWFGR